jgi:hypothetical protein
VLASSIRRPSSVIRTLAISIVRAPATTRSAAAITEACPACSGWGGPAPAQSVLGLLAAGTGPNFPSRRDFLIGCESAANLLSRVSIKTFQELADEAFRDLLQKYGRPTDLKAALQESAKGPVSGRHPFTVLYILQKIGKGNRKSDFGFIVLPTGSGA